jgi:tRNA(fMet)-specific endonuclease VapC
MSQSGSALLDTNAVILLLNDDPSLLEAVRSVSESFVSIITLGELYFGANKSSRRQSNLDKLTEFIKHCTLLNCTSQTAFRYGEIRLALMRKGTPIPHNDIWIAATALEHSLAIVTRDAHFSEIEGLQIEAW